MAPTLFISVLLSMYLTALCCVYEESALPLSYTHPSSNLFYYKSVLIVCPPIELWDLIEINLLVPRCSQSSPYYFFQIDNIFTLNPNTGILCFPLSNSFPQSFLICVAREWRLHWFCSFDCYPLFCFCLPFVWFLLLLFPFSHVSINFLLILFRYILRLLTWSLFAFLYRHLVLFTHVLHRYHT